MTAAPELATELAAIRESYDTVAVDYTELLRDNLAEQPYDRAVLGLFAELVRAGGGPVADLGCGPGRITAHLAGLGSTPQGSTCRRPWWRLPDATTRTSTSRWAR